jgi:ABC-2 type transport system permease protein
MKHYLAFITTDIKLALRMRIVIFFNYLFPLIFFFTFAAFLQAGSSPERITQVLTMSVALGILGNGLFGAGMRAIQEREMNILRRYKVTPITPAPLIVASMVTGLIIFLPYIFLVVILSHVFYKMPWPPAALSLLFFICLGLIAFRAIGMVIAAVANNMQEGAILIQLCYFPMLFLSGATIPRENFGHTMRVISDFIPSTYLVLGIKDIMLRSQTLVQDWRPVLALMVATVVGVIVGMKLFRWEKEEKIQTSAKLWILAVLLPFLILGVWQAYQGS